MTYSDLYILYTNKLAYGKIDLVKELCRLEKLEKYEECSVVRDIIHQMNLATKKTKQ